MYEIYFIITVIYAIIGYVTTGKPEGM